MGRFAAEEHLRLVLDEICVHSVFESPDTDSNHAAPFESILSIDFEKEAGLSRNVFRVVTSTSKDFGIYGFRLYVYLN